MRKAIRNLQAVGEKVAAVILEPIQGKSTVLIKVFNNIKYI